ncbi:protein kinase [Aureococcus anophagefferens]|uniref:Protein kinase n=1 Tax=Aureococcus anophagefferens TaxID=44056 RepID=A0ABR1GAW6_AURAN
MRAWYSIIIFFVWGLAPKASGQELAKLVASDAAAGDEFGWSVAISGDLVVVGAEGNDDAGSGSGSAYVFRTTNGGASWTQTAKLVASDADEFDNFGSSVAISGDLVVVVARSSISLAYVFRTTNGGDSWTQTAKLVTSGAGSDFYESVAISGDLIVVGAERDATVGEDAGSAYVFRTTNGGDSWTQTTKLIASDAAADDMFGGSVAISGDLVVVGAPSSDRPAYVFRTTNGGASWTQVAKLVASDAAAGDSFGSSVAVSGDLVVVGAFRHDSDSGSAYVFRTTNNGASWTETAKLVPSDGDHFFGSSVAISGETVVVGARQFQYAPTYSPTHAPAYSSADAAAYSSPYSAANSSTDAAAKPAAYSPPYDEFRRRRRRRRWRRRRRRGHDRRRVAPRARVAVAIACLCIKRRRTKAAAARADINLEAPPDRDDAFAGGARNVAGAARHSASTKTPVPSAPPASASFAAAPAAEPVPSARYQQLMRESEGVIAQGMNAVHVLLALGQVAGGPVVGPICEVARDILRSVEEHSRKADDVVMAGRRVVDVLGALQQMSKNAAKLEFGNADLVESKMQKLKGLLCDFKLAVDAFGRAGWLKRAFHQRGHVNSLTKLDKEIATCLESLKLDYKLAVDADILQRTYQMEQSITMLVAKRCSETHEDPAAAAAILARTPVAIAEVVENAHVPEDELRIEMRELSGEVSKGLAKILDSHRETQQGVATILKKLETSEKRDRARRLKRAHTENNEIKLDTFEAEPFADGGQGTVHKAEYAGEIVCLKKFSLLGPGIDQAARDKIKDKCMKEVGIMTQLRPNPRTVDIIGVYTTDPTFFGIIMQYLPNGSLRGILYTRGDAITSKLQFTWAKDIATGMAYLHEEGVLHRDLKTQNVLLTNDWRCKITDFGVSQCPALKTAVTRQSIRGDTKKTPGTVLFKAPEAWSSKNTFTTKSDVYSYAIVLWEIWDRGDPWDNMDECEIMHAVCIDQARPEVPDVMPVEVRALMCRAWSQEVASRPDFKDIVTQLYIIEGQGQ